MAELNYAFIKGINVVNIAVFDNPTESLLEHFKEAFGVDNIILGTRKAVVGGTYEDGVFWEAAPHPSWVKNHELNEWDPPVPLPTSDKVYTWNEDTVSWDLEPTEPGEQP
jgi:hypothetical protein